MHSGVVSVSALNKSPSSKLTAVANHNLVLEGAKKIGCKLENISAEDLYDCKVGSWENCRKSPLVGTVL